MVKLRKEKILVSLIVITLIALVIGNVSSLATDLTATPTNNTNTGTTGAVITASPRNNTVGATTNNTSTNNTTNNTTNTENNVGSAGNTSRYSNNSKNTGKLPYAGSNSSIIFVVIALVASAIYAYKKVSDYNV